ncbi:MAG TPA: TonB-dependent receptor plug domain-containing protein [Saprospiraceae bacterium]|nr:TonB-dependent receptor plug domain-containing protein [Saprospiraceae bacterium]
MKTLSFLFSILSFMMVIACSSSKSASGNSSAGKVSASNKVEDLNPATDLADHLKRVPGVSVSGSGSSATAIIRGMSSLTGSSEPLFVINGTPISGGLGAANSQVSVSDIKSVRVLKTPSETSMYGIRGASGVIVIELKH